MTCIKNKEENLLKGNILPNFHVEKSTEIQDKTIEIFSNYPEIFTDDLPDLEKIPDEIVLNHC